MTPLRKRMIEDMQLRNFSPQTQRTYLHHIAGLAQFYQTSPEHLDLEDMRQYQVYLAGQCRYSAESLNQFVSAAKFLYGVTLEHYAASRTMPHVGAALPFILHLNCRDAA
jgi:integrase/recombinase XerD